MTSQHKMRKILILFQRLKNWIVLSKAKAAFILRLSLQGPGACTIIFFTVVIFVVI